jgi:hypothetical protein
MGELADVRYFPEIDYAGRNFEPIGKRISKTGIAEDDIIIGPVEDLCTRCINYYKNLGARNVIDKWPIKCMGDRSKKIETMDPVVLASLDEDERAVLVSTLDPVVWAKKYLNFEARWYQADMLNCSSQFKVVRAGRRVGKALAIDTPIPTPNGWTTMGELRRGDIVFGSDGKPTTVTMVTEVMENRTCYDVIFSDGEVITADADHKWVVWSKSARRASYRTKNPTAGPETLTTSQILNTLYVKAGDKVEVNYSIPVAEAVEYPRKDLPIDPYVLGAWLGDGKADGGQFTTADPDILIEFASAGYHVTAHRTRYSYNITGLSKQLKILGIRNTTKTRGGLAREDFTKRIPTEYLQSSADQRMALLQGLMDTDGYADKDGGVEFCTSEKELANDVLELIFSLGFRATCKESDSRLYGRIAGKRYRIVFSPWKPVFRLKRKLSRQRIREKPSARQGWRYIVAIQPRQSVPVRCIEVDSSDHCYLAGRAFIPTHNSETMSIKILHSAFTKNGKDVGRYVILVVCPYEAQVKAIFDNILALKNRSPELIESFDGSSMSPWEIRWKNGSVIKGFSAAKKTSARSNKIRGQGANEVYFDEIDYMADEDIETVMAVLLDQPDTTVWMSSTPTGIRSKFWQMCVDKMKGFKEFHYVSKESPRWKPHIEELMLGMYSQGGYDREFNAEFGQPMQGVFRQKDLDRARFKWDYSKAKRVDNTHLVMGVDWNKHTGTHIVLLESGMTDNGPLYKVVYKEVIRKSDFTQHEGVEAILRIDREWHPDYIYVDEGYGAMQVEALWRYDKLNPHLRLDYAKRIRKVQGNENVIIPNPLGGDPIKKMAKPFMVDSLAHWVELGFLKIPECEDTQTPLIEAEIPFVNIGLIQQMREFRVEKYSPSGQPRYSQGYEHTLMALGFAALGTLMNFSELKQTISTVQAVYDPRLFTDKPKPANDLENVKDAKAPSVAETAARLRPGRVIPGAGVGLPGVGGNFYRKSGLSDLGSGKLGLGSSSPYPGRSNIRPDRTIP